MRSTYNKPILFFLSGFFLLAILMGCQQRDKSSDPIPADDFKEPLVNVNKKLVGTEDELIDAFIGRYGWEMTKTGTGLRYMIYSHASGPKAIPGYQVTIMYSVTLLSGDTCYPSVTRSFVIGRDKVEPGIDEGIRLLKVGDKAKFILPSHLAFGLLGDRKAIPQKATLVYDIQFINMIIVPQIN